MKTTPPQKYTSKNWVPLWVLIRIPKPQNEEYLVRYICTPEKPHVPIKIPLVPIKIPLNRHHFSISWPAGVVTLGLSHLDIARLERLEGEGWTFGKGQIIDQPFIWAIIYIYIYNTMVYIYILFPVFFKHYINVFSYWFLILMICPTYFTNHDHHMHEYVSATLTRSYKEEDPSRLHRGRASFSCLVRRLLYRNLFYHLVI